MYTETYRDLSHGTDTESAETIKKEGFEIRGGIDSWCGEGVYFYNIKKKAWWAAKRKCNELKKKNKKSYKPTVLFADIIDIEDEDILDLRVLKDLCDFEKQTSDLFAEYKIDITNKDIDKNILLRSMLISFYADTFNKKLVIGNFKQRPQSDHQHAIEFSDSLDMVFGIETIYCVKDKSIIVNIH
jgi:hypothetical protein